MVVRKTISILNNYYLSFKRQKRWFHPNVRIVVFKCFQSGGHGEVNKLSIDDECKIGDEQMLNFYSC